MNNYHFAKTSAFEEVKGINQTSLLPPLLLRDDYILCSVLFELPRACQKRSVGLQ